MWVMLRDSFISCVENIYDTDTLMVRSRTLDHLQAFLPEEFHPKIFTMKDSDYAYRAVMSKKDVAEIVSKRIMGIDYPNFKNSVDDEVLHDFYSAVWYQGLYMQHPELGYRSY